MGKILAVKKTGFEASTISEPRMLTVGKSGGVRGLGEIGGGGAGSGEGGGGGELGGNFGGQGGDDGAGGL